MDNASLKRFVEHVTKERPTPRFEGVILSGVLSNVATPISNWRMPMRSIKPKPRQAKTGRYVHVFVSDEVMERYERGAKILNAMFGGGVIRCTAEGLYRVRNSSR